MAISKRLRYEILRRDAHTCRYCGARAPDVPLTVDHVVPTALGGTDDPSNLVTSCGECNAGKSASSPDAPFVEQVAEDALMWRQVTEAAAVQLRAQRHDAEEYTRQFLDVWEEECGYWSLPRDWRGTAERFYEAGVQIEDVRYAADATASAYGVAYHWSYFCGVLWRLVRERDALATQMMKDAKEHRD